MLTNEYDTTDRQDVFLMRDRFIDWRFLEKTGWAKQLRDASYINTYVRLLGFVRGGIPMNVPGMFRAFMLQICNMRLYGLIYLIQFRKCDIDFFLEIEEEKKPSKAAWSVERVFFSKFLTYITLKKKKLGLAFVFLVSPI